MNQGMQKGMDMNAASEQHPAQPSTEASTTQALPQSVAEGEDATRRHIANGLKAGDVVCAKTSTGAKVKVTIPADAQEGDTVRFALPSQVQAAKLSKKASKADSRLNVRDVDEGGVGAAVGGRRRGVAAQGLGARDAVRARRELLGRRRAAAQVRLRDG